MRLICTALLMSASFVFSYAQDLKKVTVSGNVVTDDGTPVEYVNVVLKNTSCRTMTDEKGHFEFKAPAGKYTLVLQSLTTHRKELSVVIGPDGKNIFPDIEVRGSAPCLEQVVVTGQFSPQSMRNSLYKVRSINAEQIRQKNPVDVQSLLNTEMGIRLSNDMALGETNFELMGMSGNNVKVLLDGVPLIDRGSTKQSLSQIDVNTIERVEIVEGPMSVVYGTDALAGVINIITKKTEVRPDEMTWNVDARIHEESVGKEYDFFKNDGVHNENVNVGFSHSSGVYVNGGYTRNNTGGWTGDKTGREKRWHPKDQSLVNATLGYKRKDLNVWYRLNFADEDLMTPVNGTAVEPHIIFDQDFLTKRFTHQVQSDWKISPKLDLNTAVSYQTYRRRTQSIWTDLYTGEQRLDDGSSSQDVTKYENWIARATATWRISPKISLQPGIEYQRTKGLGGRIEGEPCIQDLAFFVSAEYKPWEWMSLRPGMRTFLMADYDAPVAVPSVLTKFRLNDKMDVRFSYAYGFRTPTIQELYFMFHHGDVTVQGNPDLKPEYSNNVTGSFTYRILHNSRMRLTTTLSGFYNVFNDRIVTATSVEDPNHAVYSNIERYKTLGGTWETNYAWGGLNANLNFSLVGRYNKYNNETGDMPNYRFSPEIAANVSYHIAPTGTDISFYYKFTGERKEYYYSEIEDPITGAVTNDTYLRGLPSYNYADITLTQRITDFLHLSAGVKNLFDLTSLQTIADSQYDSPSTSYLGCGRSWFVGLNINLDGKIKNKK